MADWQSIRNSINKAELARALGVNRSSVCRWNKVPDRHREAVAEYLEHLAK